jgi:hypothetical protein
VTAWRPHRYRLLWSGRISPVPAVAVRRTSGCTPPAARGCSPPCSAPSRPRTAPPPGCACREEPRWRCRDSRFANNVGYRDVLPHPVSLSHTNPNTPPPASRHPHPTPPCRQGKSGLPRLVTGRRRRQAGPASRPRARCTTWSRGTRARRCCTRCTSGSCATRWPGVCGRSHRCLPDRRRSRKARRSPASGLFLVTRRRSPPRSTPDRAPRRPWSSSRPSCSPRRR